MIRAEVRRCKRLENRKENASNIPESPSRTGEPSWRETGELPGEHADFQRYIHAVQLRVDDEDSQAGVEEQREEQLHRDGVVVLRLRLVALKA